MLRENGAKPQKPQQGHRGANPRRMKFDAIGEYETRAEFTLVNTSKLKFQAPNTMKTTLAEPCKIALDLPKMHTPRMSKHNTYEGKFEQQMLKVVLTTVAHHTLY